MILYIGAMVGNHGKQGGAIRAVHTLLSMSGTVLANNRAFEWGKLMSPPASIGWDIGGNGGAILQVYI